MSALLDSYISAAPSQGNALSIFKGEWTSRFPPPLDSLDAGTTPLFEDPRVTWAITELGGVAGKNILELGPLEAGHTYMLEQHGASSILAIEANTRAFLKCLIVKELLSLKRARFLCGDFRKFVPAGSAGFDAVFASGVLYHMTEPVQLLSDIARTAPQMYLWTHYYDAKITAKNRAVQEHFGSVESGEVCGFRYEQVRYEYQASLEWVGFCGGSAPHSFWLSRETILAALSHFGFRHVSIEFDVPEHPNGPSFALVARQ
jgi:hypothetical protein